MNLQTYIINATLEAAKEAFKYAKAVPEDRVAWQPLDTGRSVLDQCRELALSPGWASDIVSGKPLMEFTDEAMAAIKKEQEALLTIADCEAECNRRLDEYFAIVAGLSDERLSDTRWLPFDGGRDFTMPEMLEYPRWNFNYHLGQIAYIQSLYGDKEMH